MKKIPVSPCYYALVDDDKYDLLSEFSWHSVITKTSRTIYAQTEKTCDGVRTRTFMHTMILGERSLTKADHRDGNGLNNQGYNLRICTHKQNMQNRRLNINSKSGFKGVSWCKRTNKWRVRIQEVGNRKRLGSFTCIIKAAQAYDTEAKKRYGEFANLNFLIGVKYE